MLKKENHGDNDNVNVNVDVITSLKYCEMESAKFNFLVWRRGGGGGFAGGRLKSLFTLFDYGYYTYSFTFQLEWF